MAKRHTDTRFIVQAIPTLFRLTGKNANQKLNISMSEEKCSCGNPALITRTEQSSTGIIIKRYCVGCINKTTPPSPPKTTTRTYDDVTWVEPQSFADRLLYPNGKPENGGFPNGPLDLR